MRALVMDAVGEPLSVRDVAEPGVPDDGVVVEVGGVGLFVSCTPTVIAGLPVGGAVRLATSLIVRDDGDPAGWRVAATHNTLVAA